MSSSSSSCPPPLTSLNGSQAVRVGVRVRPLTGHEQQAVSEQEAHVLHCPAGTREVRLGSTERRFTYDAVFDQDTAQQDLYQQVAPPLLTSFLDGFNATIMAYGQTGSGKTFTMGSEAHSGIELSDSTGLIPRFMNDMFAALQKKQEASSSAAAPTSQKELEQEARNLSFSSSQSTTSAALIEYSIEASFLEVYGEDVHDLLVPSRPSVPIREDASGGVVCSGLTQKPVRTAQAALQVLHEGTLHRTTAATLMNLTSSRSHAVFTVTLTQTTLGEDGVEVATTSRFTFVDLAGSERMKKTGAEGERAREGIKINEGLLALGNVINALADDEHKKAGGKRQYVPYRQSKLTRLLQDALGGNSQTLFLACVSPSPLNASETLSTLRYANRARNIQNAPVQNVDATVLELQQLRSWSSVLQQELLQVQFGPDVTKENNNNDGNGNNNSNGIWERDDVKEYFAKLLQKTKSSKTSSSSAIVPFVSTGAAASSATAHAFDLKTPPARSGFPSNNEEDRLGMTDSFEGVNPEDDMEILNRLLELQQRDQDFTQSQREEHQKLKQVDGELAKEENLLLQLRDNLKAYQNIKDKYEALMNQVQKLEAEKTELSVQLDKATKDPTQGCETTIRRNLETVDGKLSKFREEIPELRKKRRMLEKETQKCHALERKINDLKGDRAAMIRKQKEATQRHREYTESKTREIMALKKKERKATQQLSKLQNEVNMQKKNLEKRQNYITKLNAKLKETESHLLKALAVRQRNLRRGGGGRRLTMSKQPPTSEGAFAGATEEVEASVKFLQKAIGERVYKADLETKYENLVTEYSETMRSMMLAVEELKQAPEGNDVEELQQKVLDLELQSELLGSDLDILKHQMAMNERASSDETAMKTLSQDKEAPVLRSILLEVLELYATSELESRQSRQTAKRKQDTVDSLDTEVEVLQQRLKEMTQKLAQVQLSSSSPSDPAASVSKEEMETLKGSLKSLQSEKDHLATDLVEAKEKYALVDTTANVQEKIQQSESTLSELQEILRSLGRDEAQQKDVLDMIENCVQDTLMQKLNEAKTQHLQVSNELTATTERVSYLSLCLGLDVPMLSEKDDDDHLPLTKKLENMKKLQAELQPKMDASIARKDKIQEGVKNILNALGLTQESLSPELQELMESGEDKKGSKNNVNNDFLTKCEQTLSSLRLKKSSIQVENNQRYEEAKMLVKDASITSNQTLKLVQRRSKEIPSWWDATTAEEIAKAFTSKGSTVSTTEQYTQHLAVIHKSLQTTLKYRKDLSKALKELVEHTQKKLLETVDGETETMEAYSSFHEALFRLPELSKERINTFLTEIEALAACVDAMTQSEIEALTVVWEALNISAADRGTFWEAVDRLDCNDDASSSVVPEENTSYFDSVLQLPVTNGESWVMEATKNAQQNTKTLKSRLTKLDAVHKEVDKLRTRQDAKSTVLSLDSEVRILNAQLADFENRKCNKDRLLNRQTGSSHLLKEERYRKQMKAKFSRKLEQLAKLLKTWLDEEGSNFDIDLLSEDVRGLLENFDHMGAWIKERKEFMHLRTVKTDRKRRLGSGSSSLDSGGSDSSSQSFKAKRSKTSPKATPSASRATRIRSKDATSDTLSSALKKAPSRPNKRASPAPVRKESAKRQKSQEDQSANKISSSSSQPTQLKSTTRLPLSPLKQSSTSTSKNTNTNTNTNTNKNAQSSPSSKQRVTRSTRARKPLSPSRVFNLNPVSETTPLTSLSASPQKQEKSTSRSYSRKALSPSRVFNLNLKSESTPKPLTPKKTATSSTQNDENALPKRRTTRSKTNSRKPFSPTPNNKTEKQSENSKKATSSSSNNNAGNRRLTRSSSAGGKRLVLPPFAHVLEQALSPMKENEE